MPRENSQKKLYDAIRRDDVDGARIALESGSDPHRLLARGSKPPLHFAAQHGRAEIARLLIEHGARPNELAPAEAMQDSGQGPLHVAALHGKCPVAKVLLEHGADANALTERGFPSLWYAITMYLSLGRKKEKAAIAKLLLEHGADPLLPWKRRTVSGGEEVLTLLEFARSEHAVEIEALLMEACAAEAVDDLDPEQIFAYAASGNSAGLRMVLERGALANARDVNGCSALHHSAMNGQTECVIILLEAGANPNSAFGDGLSPLHAAVLHKQHKIAEELLRGGADPNARVLNVPSRAPGSRPGMTPLHLARGELRMVKLLLENGASAEALDDSGSSVLATCVGLRKSGVASAARAARLLLEHGADPSAGRSDSFGTLRMAVESAHYHLYHRGYAVKASQIAGLSFEVLLEILMGKDVPELGPFRHQPNSKRERIALKSKDQCLAAAERRQIVGMVQRGDKASLQQRLQDGMSPEAALRPDRSTSLMIAANFGQTELMELFLQAGAKPDHTNSYDRTALHFAALGKCAAAVRVLAKRGCDLNAQDRDGFTPLHLAAKHCTRTDVTEALLEAGADPNAITHECSTNAETHKDTPLHIAAAQLQIAQVQCLLEKGADCRRTNARNRTPLHGLAGADQWEERAFDRAVKGAEILLAAGCDPNARDHLGHTPVFLACGSHNKRLLRTLLAAGGSPDMEDASGTTPTQSLQLRFPVLDHFIEVLGLEPVGYEVEMEIVQLLREFGARK